MHPSDYLYMYIYIHVCMRICLYTHIYTHIKLQNLAVIFKYVNPLLSDLTLILALRTFWKLIIVRGLDGHGCFMLARVASGSLCIKLAARFQ